MSMPPANLQTSDSLAPTVAAEPPRPPQQNRLLWPFWGTDGLRSFWRLVIFVALVFGLRFGMSKILHLLHLVKPHTGNIEFTAKFVLVQDGLAFLCVLLATLIMGRFEKRSLGDYGLPPRSAFRLRFWEGIVWGFVAECATMFTLFLAGNATFHGFSLTGMAALQSGLLWAVAFLLVG